MIIEWQIDKPQEAIAFQQGLNRITIKSPFKAKGAKIDPFFFFSCWLSRSLFPALKHQLTKVNRKGIPFRWVFYPTTEDKINNNLKLEDDEGEEEIEIRSRGGSFTKCHEKWRKGTAVFIYPVPSVHFWASHSALLSIASWPCSVLVRQFVWPCPVWFHLHSMSTSNNCVKVSMKVHWHQFVCLFAYEHQLQDPNFTAFSDKWDISIFSPPTHN